MGRPLRLLAAGIFLGILSISAASPSAAQKERSRGILRNLIQTIAPESPEELEYRARETRDVATALDLYGTLESRHGGRPEGIRASLWLGLYEYGRNDHESALVHFEQARKNARDPLLRARATFWCEQARLITGREPITDDPDGMEGGFWGTLRGLTRVDRSIHAGRRSDAEQELLLLEGEARHAGLLGPEIARWGDILRAAGTGGGRLPPEALRPMLRAAAELPERLRIQLPDRAPADSTPPAEDKWTIQFGAFLDRDHATALVETLEARGVHARIEEGEEGGREWSRVRLDASLDRAEADSLSGRLQESAGVPCQVVPLP